MRPQFSHILCPNDKAKSAWMLKLTRQQAESETMAEAEQEQPPGTRARALSK